MTNPLPASLKTQFERPHAPGAIVWLLELEVLPATSVDPPTIMRLTTYHQDVSWPVGDPLPKTWNAFGLQIGNLELSGEGDLPHLDVSVSNATRFAMRYLHVAHGFEGRPVKLYLLTEAGLAIAYPNQEAKAWRFVVASAAANAEAITLRLSQANFFMVKVPPDRYVPARCRWKFGSAQCGYSVNSVSAFTTCNKTFADCVARGADEAALLRPVLHPRRFGGFPGIPQQRN